MNDVKNVEHNVGKVTAIVTYYTRYISVNKLPMLLSFGLGNKAAVNAIIGKPIIKEWRDCGDFNNDTFTSEEIMLQFDMEYKSQMFVCRKMLYLIILDLLDRMLNVLLEHTLYQLIEVIILRL